MVTMGIAPIKFLHYYYIIIVFSLYILCFRSQRKYRSRIEQFIISLAQHADKKDFSKTATDLTARVNCLLWVSYALVAPPAPTPPPLPSQLRT